MSFIHIHFHRRYQSSQSLNVLILPFQGKSSHGNTNTGAILKYLIALWSGGPWDTNGSVNTTLSKYGRTQRKRKEEWKGWQGLARIYNSILRFEASWAACNCKRQLNARLLLARTTCLLEDPILMKWITAFCVYFAKNDACKNVLECW